YERLWGLEFRRVLFRPLPRRQFGEKDRERADGAHHVDPMAEAVHVRELRIEVEPVGPAVENVVPALLAQIGIAAALVDLGARKRSEERRVGQERSAGTT